MKEYDQIIKHALEAHVNGDLENARSSYKKILNINPEESIALAWLGSLEAINKNYEDAICLIQHAIKIEPLNSDYLANLASVLCECNLLNDALFQINLAIEINKKNSIYYKNRAVININLKNFNDAKKDIEQLIKIDGTCSSETFLLIGNAQYGLGENREALSSYEKAIEQDNCNYEAYLNKANLLAKIKNHNGAIEAYMIAISINNNLTEAYSHLASVYLDLDDLNNAVIYCKKALEINPINIHAMNIYGLVNIRLTKFQDAITYFDKIILLQPDNPNANYNKSLVLMRLGNFKVGLPLYEWRWKTNEFENSYRLIDKPLWLGGESINCKRILIYCEQGLGDTIQFSRYIEDIVKLGAIVTVQVPYVLMSLLKNLSRLSGLNVLISDKCDHVDFDFYCPIMSLPLALGGIGKHASYLIQDNPNIDKWKNYLGNRGFKIAICWQGNQNSEADIGRSFSVNFFSLISKIKNVRLISIQKNCLNCNVTKLKDLNIEELPEDFDTTSGAFMDSAAIMKCVDLVITSDTALTHLAGALGVRTLLLLQHVPDWRWGLNKEDTIWYSNHKLIRQNFSGDWNGVFEKLKIEIEELLSKHNSDT